MYMRMYIYVRVCVCVESVCVPTAALRAEQVKGLLIEEIKELTFPA